MAQLFSAKADRRLRLVLWALVTAVVALVTGGLLYARSDARWGVGKPQPQPIAFQHSLHAGALGIDCAYCHVSAARAPSAGMPSTRNCLTCHSQVWRGTPQLAPLHRAAAAGEGLPWRSVSRMPAHVRFHHGSHARAGLNCATCHGAVSTMVETVKTESFSMGWCLDCHRNAAEQGAHPIRTAAAAPRSHWNGRNLTNCEVCHY